MSKKAKDLAHEMLKMSTSVEGKKEVVNACLFILKTLTENDSKINSKDIEKMSGGRLYTADPCMK